MLDESCGPCASSSPSMNAIDCHAARSAHRLSETRDHGVLGLSRAHSLCYRVTGARSPSYASAAYQESEMTRRPYRNCLLHGWREPGTNMLTDGAG